MNVVDLKCAKQSELENFNSAAYSKLNLNSNSLVYKWGLSEFRLIDYSKFNSFLEFYLRFDIYYNNERYYFMADCKYLKSDFSMVVSEYNSNLDFGLNDLSNFYCQKLFDKNSIISFMSYAAKHNSRYA
jgi:hypothetical protein